MTEDTNNFEELMEVIRPEISFDIQNEASEKNSVEKSERLTENRVFEKNPIKKAKQLCNDTIGWLRIPNTLIDYPVVQGADNDYYLHHSMDQKENELGCPFLDYRCESDFSGFTNIIYGHHFTEMRMFADIFSFKDRNFLEEHSSGYLITETEMIPITFFAYLNVKSNSPIYHAVFLTDKEKLDYIDTLYDEALYTVSYEKIDLIDKRFILLSTCTFEFDDARGVLVGFIE